MDHFTRDYSQNSDRKYCVILDLKGLRKMNKRSHAENEFF